MYFVLFTKILQGASTGRGSVLHTKGVQEFVVKTVDIYTYKDFLKIPYKQPSL